MPACVLRPATQYDTDAVYALICELKQAEFDHQAFRVGFNANLRDPNMQREGPNASSATVMKGARSPGCQSGPISVITPAASCPAGTCCFA